MESELTKEQIVAEGWTFIKTKNHVSLYEKKGLYGLKYNEVTKEAFFARIDINSQREYAPNIGVSANCPDLKTFKYLCQMMEV
jgi:hypothetical protein